MKKLIDFFDFFAHKPMILTTTLVISFLKTLLDVVEVHLFSDWDFLISMLIMVHLDTLLGIWKSAKFKQVSSRGFAGYFEKLIMYFVFLIATHQLFSFPIEGKPNVLFGWIKNLSYTLIMVREAISLVENIGVIRPGLINPNILSYLKKFDASGKFSDLQNPNQDATHP